MPDSPPSPTTTNRGVPIGKLVRFWFEEVWSKHADSLQAGTNEPVGAQAQAEPVEIA